jgi:hypothetical protein
MSNKFMTLVTRDAKEIKAVELPYLAQELSQKIFAAYITASKEAAAVERDLTDMETLISTEPKAGVRAFNPIQAVRLARTLNELKEQMTALNAMHEEYFSKALPLDLFVMEEEAAE